MRERSPAVPEQECSAAVSPMPGARARRLLQWRFSCCCCRPLFSVCPSSDDEEMLISEEEVPFKDDPRDETYKPHLEKYVGLHTYCGFRPKTCDILVG